MGRIAIKSLGIFLVFGMFFSCGAKKNTAKTGLKLIEGTQFYYTVSYGDYEYDFYINLNSFDREDGFSFDWYLDNNRGSVFMKAEALKSAMALHNYFNVATITLSDKTSVWISEKMFQAIKTGKPVEIDLGKEKQTFTLKRKDIYTFKHKVFGEKIQVPILVISTSDNEKEIWIIDNIENSLIVKMNLEFKIKLNSYKQYDDFK